MKNILIFSSRFTRTDTILNDIGAALSHHNFNVVYEDNHLRRDQYADDFEWFNVLSDRIYSASPDFVIMNGIEGIISSNTVNGKSHLLEILQIPFISVNFESPIKSLYRRIDIGQSSLSSVAINERSYIDNLKSFGFRHIFYFPGATNADRFFSESAEMP